MERAHDGATRGDTSLPERPARRSFHCHLQAASHPGGSDSVSYAYDTAGRLATLTDWAARTHTYAYDADSRLTSVSAPGNLLATFSYYDVNRLTGIDYERNSAGVLALGNLQIQGATAYAIDSVDPEDALVVRLQPGSRDDAGPLGDYALLVRGSYASLCKFFDPASEVTPAECR
jgi:YD repeat-containing protein